MKALLATLSTLVTLAASAETWTTRYYDNCWTGYTAGTTTTPIPGATTVYHAPGFTTRTQYTSYSFICDPSLPKRAIPTPPTPTTTWEQLTIHVVDECTGWQTATVTVTEGSVEPTLTTTTTTWALTTTLSTATTINLC
ncbi:hypothetical protein M408DRAFT_27573 [Serendipita vermifera MAFF 305830]|uniref:Uncharacterized protein n=1 Tax=Serendipita vermifera MAFF 305830 TaxID=933852 RepID=A0A0C2X353_SERVB|nr:hypothetical protein M408DRAFT_31160 [Serendipita vermifera MAFF 305830]KIM23867.1 hypothetical protein M408DRAFT_27573 [Serendipita vermifera MAFF 305830]